MRILLALDGSPSSVAARDLVAGLEWPAGTRIRLATVSEPPVDWTGGMGAGMVWVGDAEDALRDELRAELRRLAEPLAGHDWNIDWRVGSGRPATAIIDAADEFHADLIVLGSRGRGPVASMLLGSVSAEVVEHARCSVLVARDDHVSRLLVATDGSAAARAIPAVIGRWGVFRGVPSDVLSVMPLPERTFELLADVYALGAHDVTGDRQASLDRHLVFADEVAGWLGEHAIPAASRVADGDAAGEIVDAACRAGCDLIVTGTRGLQGLQRALLGSVARNVLVHAPCSVMVIRAAPVPVSAPAGAGHGVAVTS